MLGRPEGRERVRLEGRALHAGVDVAVTLVRAPGPVILSQGAHAARLADLRVARTDRGVEVSDGRLRVDLVEHLMAALGGLGVREGILVEIDGPELPLLDGGARTFVEALGRLRAGPLEPLRPSRDQLVVARPGQVLIAGSSYDFAPGERVELEVEISFDHPAIGVRTARWDGAPEGFISRIAPARTFGFVREAELLRARGRARAAFEPGDGIEGSVLLFDDRTARPDGRPFDPDEPALHKLLDLIGDLYLHGGPVLGRLRASRPGHTATHRAIREALDRGIVVRP